MAGKTLKRGHKTTKKGSRDCFQRTPFFERGFNQILAVNLSCRGENPPWTQLGSSNCGESWRGVTPPNLWYNWILPFRKAVVGWWSKMLFSFLFLFGWVFTTRPAMIFKWKPSECLNCRYVTRFPWRIHTENFLSSVNFYPFLWSFSPFNIGRIQNWSKNDKLLFQMIFLKRQLVSEGPEQFHQSEGIRYPLYMKVRKPSKSDSMSLNQVFFYQLLFYRVCKNGLFLGVALLYIFSALGWKWRESTSDFLWCLRHKTSHILRFLAFSIFLETTSHIYHSVVIILEKPKFFSKTSLY